MPVELQSQVAVPPEILVARVGKAPLAGIFARAVASVAPVESSELLADLVGSVITLAEPVRRPRRQRVLPLMRRIRSTFPEVVRPVVVWLALGRPRCMPAVSGQIPGSTVRLPESRVEPPVSLLVRLMPVRERLSPRVFHGLGRVVAAVPLRVVLLRVLVEMVASTAVVAVVVAWARFHRPVLGREGTAPTESCK